MSFAEDYAAGLLERGIEVDPATIPDRDVVETGLGNVQAWLADLHPDLREGFDEGSLEFAVCHLLAMPELDVAPEIQPILEAFDQIPGQRLSELTSVAQECLESVPTQ
jgi:hypothetical protein